tara:strand:- start:30649 stop:31749 length:1101 start_codon:yes stop_codon:yes gene_type:complete
MKNYFNPVKIIKSKDWLYETKKAILQLNIKTPILVTSPGNRKRLNLDSLFSSNLIFSNAMSNPTFDDCGKVIEFCGENNFDGVIAIGGGSAMDLAKVVISYISLKKKSINELINYNKHYINKTPSIFLPTTHGTASEVTMWGTLWNLKEKKKYSISNPSLYPCIAILDGSLTQSLPLDISIITIMDALSHSFEAIWNKNANKLSTNYAISAICQIIENIEKLKKNPNNLKIRNTFLDASTTAGLAFSNTATAAAHSISYPLTLRYGIPHGVASSISLIPLLRINSNHILNPLKKIYTKLGLESMEELIEKIKNIPHNIIKYRLRDWGVQKSDLSWLVSKSFTKGRMDNNIVDLNENIVESILVDIY